MHCVCALMAYKKCYVLDWLGDFSCTKILFVQKKISKYFMTVDGNMHVKM